ncbi:Arm DNA-binding domain-containing protein [Streptomyces sp. NPDC058297]|uniref:Arm DNA-binding domain-containing protein n=1 Tax=Streptomyces sp. NPDC058297 TaxID=3346433 RepID=UPI0036EC14D1
MNHNRHSPGRIYRRCGCRGKHGKQLGPRCPRLAADPRHGSWALAIDVPRTIDGRRRTLRRSGFTTHSEAETALAKMRQNLAAGLRPDPTETVAAYLLDWLQTVGPRLRPATLARYRAYIDTLARTLWGSRTRPGPVNSSDG